MSPYLLIGRKRKKHPRDDKRYLVSMSPYLLIGRKETTREEDPCLACRSQCLPTF